MALIVFVLVLIEMAGVFEQAMVAGALPYFADLFEVDYAAVSWIITVFVLAGAASAVLAGTLGDMYGRRKVLIALLLVSLLGSVISIVFANLPAIIVGRALQGTSAGILPLLIGIAREVLPKQRVPVVVALLTATVTITSGFSVFIAGLFIDAGAWHYMFVVAGALCLVTLLLTWLVLPPVASVKSGRIDWPGALLMAPALIALLYGLSTAQKKGIDDLPALGCICVGALLLAAWVWWELHTPEPLVDLRLLFDPRMARAMLIILLAGLGPMAVPTVASPLLAMSPSDRPIGLGLTATQYGLIVLGTACITLCIAPITGRVAAKNGAAVSAIIGVGLLATAFAIYMTPGLNSYVAGLFVAATFISVGTTFMLSAVFNLIVENVPEEVTSKYTSVAQVARNITISIGTVVASTLLSSSVVPGTTSPTTFAWSLTMLYAIVVSFVVIGIAVSMFIQRRRRNQTRVDGATPQPVSVN